MAYEQAPVAGEFADVAGRKPEVAGAGQHVRRAVRRHGQHHALLRFGQPDLPRLQPGVFAVDRGEVDRHAGGLAEFTHRGGESARPAVGEGMDQRIRTVEQVDEQVGDKAFDDRIADLHRGTGHFAGRGIHRHGGKRRPADAVTPGRPADHHDAVAGLRAGQFVITGHDFPDAAAENQRVGRVTRIVEHGTGHGRDAHFVAVVGHPFDHTLLDDGRMEHARRQRAVVEVARSEAKDIGQGHRPGRGGEDIADDAAHSRVGAAEGFDRARMVVGLRFDREADTVGESDDAGVAVEGGNNERRGDGGRCLAQLAKERGDFTIVRLDVCAECLVRAVVAPGLRDGFQFRIGRIASGFPEPCGHHGHFFRIEGERACRVDAGQFLRIPSADRHDFDAGRFTVRHAGEAGLHGARRPCLDDRIAEQVVDEKVQILFRQGAASGDEETRSGGCFDPQTEAGRAFGKLRGHAVGHPGPARHFDDPAVRMAGGFTAIEARGTVRPVVDQSRHQAPQAGGVRVSA